MDKYEGIYRVEARLTDKSEYDFRRYKSENAETNKREEVALYERGYTDAVRFDKYENDAVIIDKKSGKVKSYQRYKGETEIYNEPLYQVRERGFYGGDEVIVYAPVKKRDESRFRGVLMRIILSVVLFFTIFGLSRIDSPISNKATEMIKNAITYDYDNKENKEIGEIRAVTLIKDLQEKENEERE